MKKAIFSLVFLSAALCSGQTLSRYDAPFPSVSSSSPPFLQANLSPNSPVLAVCNSPANTVPCTNYLTTYMANGTACLNGAQDTPQPAATSSCQPTGDAQGNIGFWTYATKVDYTVCISNNCFGPYTITPGGGGGGGATTPNQSIVFSGALSASLNLSTAFQNVVTACYDSSGNQIQPASVTNPAPYGTITFGFAIPQSGYCVANTSGGGSGGGGISGVLTQSGSGLIGGGTSGTLNMSLTNTCSVNQVLSWNGTAWVCAANGLVSGATANGGLALSSTTLGLLTSCATNQVLQWSGTAWVCATISGGGGGSPGQPANSLQFNNSSAFAGAIGASYTAGSGINPGTVNLDNANTVVTVTADYNFAACASGCSYVTSGLTTITAGSNTVTLTPVPIGVNGSDANHTILIVPASGDSSPVEQVLITGGTAVSGAASGTLTFTAAYAHSTPNYVLESATTGIQEANLTCPTVGCVLKFIPGNSYFCYAPIFFTNGNLELDGQGAVIWDASIATCFNVGGWPTGTGNTGHEGANVHGFSFKPLQNNWSVNPNGSVLAPAAITGISESSTTVTVTSTLNPGTGTNNVSISGSSVSGYNGTWSVTSSNSTSFQFTTTSGLSTCSSVCGVAGLAALTVTVPTCPANFYAGIPNQELWLAGTLNGSPTTPFGYGEYVFTTPGGTCLPGVTNGTVNLVPYTGIGFNSFFGHGSGFSLSNGVNADIEDTLANNAHFHDLRWISQTGYVGVGIQVNADEGCAIDNINMATADPFRADADFQGSGIFSPGPGSGNAAICYLGHNVIISGPSHCVNWFAGNDFDWSDGICQNFQAGGIVLSAKRGGFAHYSIGPNVHFEIGGLPSPWGAGVALGNPQVMVDITPPSAIYSTQLITGSAFDVNDASPYPTFFHASSFSNVQFYYLVAHTNNSNVTPFQTNCSTGGDCLSGPILIGNAEVDDPSAGGDAVTVNWYGWGANPTNLAINNTPNPSSYDLLRVSFPNGDDYPQVPVGTGTYLVASGLNPSSVCNIHNVCTFTDSVAPGSLGSYTVQYYRQANSGTGRDYHPITNLLPGVFSIGGDGSVAHEFTGPSYVGFGTCINSFQGLGSVYVGIFNTPIGNDSCPPQLAPIAKVNHAALCMMANGVCPPGGTGNVGSGFVTIATGTTSTFVETTEINKWSGVTITQDTSAQTAANLGVSGCNSTPANFQYGNFTYTVPLGFTITASSTPSGTPYCIYWELK